MSKIKLSKVIKNAKELNKEYGKWRKLYRLYILNIMTTEEVRAAVKVMEAFANGAEIQYSHKGQNNWMNWINKSSPSFDWQTFNYRIKPENHLE